MESPRLFLYVLDLQRQARIAVKSAHELDNLNDDHERWASEDFAEANFALAQRILTAAALSSKLLWADTNPLWPPERRTFALDRAKRLRSIVKPAPILQRRAVRNSIEHFDERLDQVYFDEPDANIAAGAIMPAGSIEGRISILRQIDPTTGIYAFLDDSVSLPDVVTAMSQVGSMAEAWLSDRPGSR